MNPELTPADHVRNWLAAGIPDAPLNDDELFAYASGDFELVDPKEIELALAQDPVAQKRLRRIQLRLEAHRVHEIETAALAGARIPVLSTPTLADWIAGQAIELTLRIRRLADSVDCSQISAGWRLLPGGEPAVLGAKSAAAAPGQTSPRKWFQVRDRWHNQITVSHSPQGCRIEVLLSTAPRGTATLQLAQPFHPDTQQAGPTRSALVHRDSAVFENCLAGLYQLTGVEGLDVWILVEPD